MLVLYTDFICAKTVFYHLEFRTGKTQLSHTLCGTKYNYISPSNHGSFSLSTLVSAQLPGANGYPGGKVIFIDTEVHTFAHFSHTVHV